MSAESGLKTFRDTGGLWENYNVYDVATPEAWERDQDLVLTFYNERRRQLTTVEPNSGHLALAQLDDLFHTVIITQNVDDLHERAGSKNIIHLHGELNKVRSQIDPSEIREWRNDLNKGDLCSRGGQLRPHIVWFGEAVPMLERAIQEIVSTDYILIIGTSMQVYPAASLTAYAPDHAKIFYVDPHPQINHELSRQRNRLTILQGPATIKVKEAVDLLINASS